MSAEKILHLFDITTVGKEVPLAEVGLHNAPFTYARADGPALNLPALGSLSGKSSRKWPPRLSCRSNADRVMASETVSR